MLGHEPLQQVRVQHFAAAARDSHSPQAVEEIA
jgi:hypothetical protein